MVLAAGLTKRLDATWAAGTNQGGQLQRRGHRQHDLSRLAREQGRRGGRGCVSRSFSCAGDGAFHLQAETGGASYLYVRRIGSILRERRAVVAFDRFGGMFKRTPVTDRSSTSAQAATLLTVSTPLGIQTRPIFSARLDVGPSTTCVVSIGDASAGAANVPIVRNISGLGRHQREQYDDDGHRGDEHEQPDLFQSGQYGRHPYSLQSEHAWLA